MQASLNGRRIKNPVVRALFSVLGVVIALGLLAGLVLVALPIAALAIGVAVVGGLAAAFIPRLRRRGPAPAEHLPRTPRGPKGVKRVEPIEPPRTVE